MSRQKRNFKFEAVVGFLWRVVSSTNADNNATRYDTYRSMVLEPVTDSAIGGENHVSNFKNQNLFVDRWGGESQNRYPEQ